MSRGLIVMYHSIVPDEAGSPEDWLQVPVTRFAQQVAWLLRWFSPASPDTFFDAQRTQQPRMLITFDDGYANNLTIAVPILRRLGVPALFFLSAGYLGEGWFWWDRLRAGLASVGRSPSAEDFAALKASPPGTIEDKVTDRLIAAGADPHPSPTDHHRPLTWAEAAALATSPDCTIGNHGWRHEIFTRLSDTETNATIARSQQILRDRLGVIPTWIAPPNGEWRASQESLLQQAGFTALATTQPGWVTQRHGAPPSFRLPRLGLGRNDTYLSLARRLVTSRWRSPPVPTSAER